MSDNAIRLLIVDDDQSILDSLSSLLDRQEGIRVIASVRNGYRAIEAADMHRPTMALVDIDLPGIDGIETAVELRKRHRNIAIVMYTAFRHEADLAETMEKVDISGFLTKDLLVSELASKLRDAAAGKKVYSDRPIELMADNYITAARDRGQYQDFRDAVEGLSERHKRVFYPLAQAKSYRQIAKETALSEATVRTYASAIFEALGVTSKAELAMTAMRSGIEFPKAEPKPPSKSRT